MLLTIHLRALSISKYSSHPLSTFYTKITFNCLPRRWPHEHFLQKAETVGKALIEFALLQPMYNMYMRYQNELQQSSNYTLAASRRHVNQNKIRIRMRRKSTPSM